MLGKTDIPCLDVRDRPGSERRNKFRNHENHWRHRRRWPNAMPTKGQTNLVFYDITASSDGRVADDKLGISRVAEVIDISFLAVAGDLTLWKTQRQILSFGAVSVH